jgi:hypothetical protein
VRDAGEAALAGVGLAGRVVVLDADLAGLRVEDR